MNPPVPLAGVRVLVVEDEILVALFLQDILEEAGARVVGPCGTLAAALEAARTLDFDIALLDVNLNSEMIFPVVAVLDERRLPYVFVTGYGIRILPAQCRGRPTLGKPYQASDVVAVVRHSLQPTAES